jgi:hypothetical protein
LLWLVVSAKGVCACNNVIYHDGLPKVTMWNKTTLNLYV